MFLHRAVSVLFLLVVQMLTLGHADAQDDPFSGYWATSNLTSIVEVTRCEDALCAEIAWLWDISVAGRTMLDEKNPRSSKQTMPMLGLQLFSQFKKDGDSWKGRIYNPEDGRTYRATVTKRGKNILRVKGCWGPFCLTQNWRRLQSISIPTVRNLSLRGK